MIFEAPPFWPAAVGTFSLATLLGWGAISGLGRKNIAAMLRPPTDPAEPAGGWPSVAIIAPARNEEEGLPRALASLEAIDYPRLEVVLVNDHSTDATGALQRGAVERRPDRFRLIEDPPLPSGWMGKNNAIWSAVQTIDPEWFLFTDADCVFAPDAIRRAVAMAAARELDLLPGFPRIELVGIGEKAAMPTITALGWAAVAAKTSRDPKRRHAAGVGAFMLARASAYRASGGHAAIAGEAVEDVWLARLMKANGARYDVMDASELLSVRIYSSLGAIFSGFRKNSYSALERNAALAVVVAFVVWLLGLGAPLAWIAGCAGWAMAASAVDAESWRLVALFGLASHGAVAFALWLRAMALVRVRYAWLLLYPAACALVGAIVLASTWDGAARGLVRWRGRVVPLERQPPRG